MAGRPADGPCPVVKPAAAKGGRPAGRSLSSRPLLKICLAAGTFENSASKKLQRKASTTAGRPVVKQHLQQTASRLSLADMANIVSRIADHVEPVNSATAGLADGRIYSTWVFNTSAFQLQQLCKIKPPCSNSSQVVILLFVY
jgi:hypothetical protein